MKVNLLMTIFLPVLSCAQYTENDAGITHLPVAGQQPASLQNVAAIPLPPGYKRVNGADSSFANWLRKVQIKKDKRVYLFNGELKRNQQAQFAVLDIPVGRKDLQQCADAVMRLRAEYLLSCGRIMEISFADNNGTKYNCPPAVTKAGFERYLEKVFAYCGTLSLEKQLKKVADFTTIQPGDVLIKGGSPGHAVLVLDVARNAAGKKIYLLAQSYMPAQDIHILINSMDAALSPWYEAGSNSMIYSPEWTFSPFQLRRW